MDIAKIINYLYAYGTDFVINVANLTGLSYYEVNAIIFCLAWPVLTLILFCLYLRYKFVLYFRKADK